MHVFVDQRVDLEAILDLSSLKTKIPIFSYKNGALLPRTHIEFSRLTINECFSLFE